MKLSSLVRGGGAFAINWFIAVIGPALAEPEFYRIFHPRTLLSSYLTDMLTGAVSLPVGMFRDVQVEADLC